MLKVTERARRRSLRRGILHKSRDAELRQRDANDLMHAPQPGNARLPLSAGRKSECVSDLKMVNEHRTARGATNKWQRRKTRILQARFFGLKVTQTDGSGGPTVEAHGGNTIHCGLEKSLVGGHVVRAVGFGVLQQSTGCFQVTLN